jgi:ribose transport system ATP-binding protein
MSNDVIILETRHIRKIFPGVVALDDVHFELRRGEVHILLGENGAGKSTLMKILSGAYQKTAGQIFLDGKEIEIKNPRHAQELGISTIYQEFNLVPHLSAGENIFLGREPTRVPGIIDRNKLFESAQKILHDLGVEINARSPVKNLGVAEKQMVEVAKALSLDAKILIMDEPTSALTEREIKELFATIRRLKEKGISIIYISHRLEELFEIGDRVTVLRDGKYVGTCKIEEVTKAELVRLMVNRELTEKFPKRVAQQGEAILQVENLCRNGILKDISFSLHRGEVLGIAGLLGSGRTELARAIFGVDKIDAGAIYVKGRRQRIKSPRTAINSGIGFLTEDRKSQGLILILSVKENISLPNLDKSSRFGILNRKDEEKTANDYLQELRIKTPNLNQKVILLSGGNQQKVVLSKWLSGQADILIFDEPTRGIDIGAKVEIYQLMNRLTAEGVGIIMISSELPEILGMSDRILIMHQGRIAGEFAAGEANQEKILQCALGS